MSLPVSVVRHAREVKEAFVDEGPIRFWLAMGVEISFSTDLITVSSGIESPYMNGVLRCSLHPRHLPRGVTMVKRRFKKEKIPFFFRVKNEGGAHFLQEELLRQDFTHDVSLAGLYVDLKQVSESSLKGHDPLVISYPSDMRGLSDVLGGRLSLSKKARRELSTLQGVNRSFPLRHFLGFVGNEISGGASMLSEAGMGYLHHFCLKEANDDPKLAIRFLSALLLHCKHAGLSALAITIDTRETAPFFELGFEQLASYELFVMGN